MRKMLISLAAAGTALAVSTPAAAQYYVGQPYGYGYDNSGQIRAMHQRINGIEWQINRLDRYAVADGVAERLRFEARQLEHQLNRMARYGLNPYEANQIQFRIGQLAQRVQYASATRYGQYDRYGHRDNGYQRSGDYDRGDRNRDRDDDHRDGD